jgi:hypothetical protein
VLGVPLVRSHIRGEVLEQARQDILREIGANKVDVGILRQEIKQDTDALTQQWLEGQVDLELRLATIKKQAAELEQTFSRIDQESKTLETVKAQIRAIQHTLSTESERLQELRADYEARLEELVRDEERLTAAIPNLLEGEMRGLQKLVQRELDELRLILADHTAGAPAMFSSHIDLDNRTGTITGTNFGTEPGRVFMKVRAFSGTGDKILVQSGSIAVPSSTWQDTEISLRLSTSVLEKVTETRNEAEEKLDHPTMRYGFLVQTAGGRLSQWSGKWVDSVIPPSRVIGTD